MKWMIAILLAGLVAIQVQLWAGQGGVLSFIHAKRDLIKQEHKNKTLNKRNQLIAADIADLKKAHQSIEERARYDMGMVKSSEIFYQDAGD